MSRPLVILDRDGVINEDSPDYIKSLREWIPLAGSLDAIARLKHAGYPVAVATNQSGLARGLFDQAALDAMHERLRALLAARHSQLDMIAFCPHGPDDGCDCRKPRPGLYRRISETLGLPLAGAVVIGDSGRDLEAAVTVGARPVLVLTGKGEATRDKGGLPDGTLVCRDLAAAVDRLLAEGAQAPASRDND
jgi:D-glycero-D-manno-heptose 1,7-bisphosphate phosphatase